MQAVETLREHRPKKTWRYNNCNHLKHRNLYQNKTRRTKQTTFFTFFMIILFFFHSFVVETNPRKNLTSLLSSVLLTSLGSLGLLTENSASWSWSLGTWTIPEILSCLILVGFFLCVFLWVFGSCFCLDFFWMLCEVFVCLFLLVFLFVCVWFLLGGKENFWKATMGGWLLRGSLFWIQGGFQVGFNYCFLWSCWLKSNGLGSKDPLRMPIANKGL